MFSTVKENKFFLVRVTVTQFGSVFLAIVLSMATANISTALLVLSSVAATAFYLSLLYTAYWDLGAAQKLRIDGGRAGYEPWAGVGLSLLANIPNILLALLVIVGALFAEQTTVAEGIIQQNWAAQLQTISSILTRVWHAMYWGFFYLLHYNSYLYLLFVLPAIVASGLGYYAGLKEFHLLVFLHLSNGEPKKKTPFNNRF